MAEPWKKYQPAQPTGPWSRYQSESEEPAYRGSILPLSRMPDGSVKFDANAGIVGALKRAVTLPGEVMRGDVPIRDDAGNLTDEVIGRATEMGAVVSPANPMVRSGDKVIPGVASALKKPKVEPPTAQQLLRAGGEGFDAMRATGAQYPASAVKRLAETAMIKLNQQGFDETTSPSTFAALKKLASPPDDAVATIGNLHSARKVFGNIGQNFGTPADQAAAGIITRSLDDFISGVGAVSEGADPVSAARRAAGALLAEGNLNYAAGKRSDLISGIERAADLRAAGANSGHNTGNAIRQRIASALLKERDTAGFSAAEKDALEGVVRGSRAANLTRDIGNKLGGGGGFSAAVGAGTGAAVGAPFGAPGTGAMIGAAIPAVAGTAIKGASNKLTQSALKDADKLVRSRSPLYEALLKETSPIAPGISGKQALIKALMIADGAKGGGGGY